MNIKDKNDNCFIYADCKAGYYCDNGSCRKAPGVGSHCETITGCDDGASCYDGICHKLCDVTGKSRFKCGFNEECSDLPTGAGIFYGLCTKKIKEAPSTFVNPYPPEPKKVEPPVANEKEPPVGTEIEPPKPVENSNQGSNPEPSSAPELRFYQNPIYIGGALVVVVILTALVTFCCVKKCGKKPKKELASTSYLGPSLAPPPPYPMDITQTPIISSDDKKQ